MVNSIGIIVYVYYKRIYIYMCILFLVKFNFKRRLVYLKDWKIYFIKDIIGEILDGFDFGWWYFVIILKKLIYEVDERWVRCKEK